MGMAPNLLPPRKVTITANQKAIHEVWPTTPTHKGNTTFETLKAAEKGEIDVLLLWEQIYLEIFLTKNLKSY